MRTAWRCALLTASTGPVRGRRWCVLAVRLLRTGRRFALGCVLPVRVSFCCCVLCVLSLNFLLLHRHR